MMLDVSGLMSTEGGGASGGSSEVGAASSSIPVEDGERSGGGGGNRWPRQETLSLLKIRSEMDVAFRDSSLKGPLWEEVSRKMLELGFQRSAKKCKEKFENVYKYHKRTKDGRATKPDGKTYRFFDQLQALESSPPPPPFTPQQPRPPMQMNAANFPHATVPSISPNPLSILPPNITNMQSNSMNINVPFQLPLINTANLPQTQPFQSSNLIFSASLPSNSSSSSTSSDEDIQRRRGRKRKWKDFFEKLTKDVVQKQEELQKKFLDTLEKRERHRTAREEAWRVEETARMNREHELLVQERSIAAAKDAAVIAFLQKVTEQPSLQIPITSTSAMNKSKTPEISIPPPVILPPQSPQPPPPPPPKVLKTDNGGDGFVFPTSTSRWPKAEIEALIKLRTNLDLKYQENGPKGPLWEEISASMVKIGYNRSSKRCKEKWENINKYYKKVKESSKRRPEDSKTCPYFNQLEALYKEKTKNEIPIMALPEQQWPIAEQREPTMHDQDQDSDINEDDEDEEDVGGYEIVTNKQSHTVEQ